MGSDHWSVDQLQNIVNASAADLLETSRDDGTPVFKRVEDINPGTLAACKVLEFDESGRLRRVVFHDKAKALEMLARLLGYRP